MSHTSIFPAWHLPTRRMTQHLAGSMQSAWSAYWTHRAERATVQMLQSLDDRTLKDIGIDRSEIESVAHNPGGDRRIEVQSRPVARGPHSSICA
jgi:uncharacterized protein YjiS (DUF1127 family)